VEHSVFFILLILFMAYAFDFINGFHDAANSIATIVTTGVLTPNQAVVWAAFFNFLAFFLFHVTVADTIGKGLIPLDIVSPYLIFSALIAAIAWNILTWFYGIPSSSSHALIGGLAGAAIVKGGGFGVLKVAGFVKVGVGIFIAPIAGMAGSLIIMLLFNHFFRAKSEQSLYSLFKSLQLASSALLSMTHGGNDAQKTMGIIAVLLFSTSWLQGEFYIPLWVVLSCYAIISLGTLAGGWRIVHTMGTQITTLNPMRGCAAETGAAAIIFVATETGVPVSTTQTVAGAIAGVGLAKGSQGTHWKVLWRIFLSWILTLPATACWAALIMLIFDH